MNGFGEESGRASADAAVERALRNVVHRSPRVEFLRELKTKFTAVAQEAPPAPSVQPERRPARSESPAPTRAGRRWGIPVAIFAAAAAVLAIVALRAEQPARWSPVDGRIGTSPIVVNGRTVAHDRIADAIADETRPHVVVAGQEAAMFWVDGTVCAELAPGSEVELGPVPSDGSQLVLAVHKGTLRMCTGPGFTGSKLTVKTPEFDLAVTGTSFAIDVDEEGTCVCCLHGSVEMVPSKAIEKPWKVEGQRMCRVYKDDRAPKWDTISTSHGPALEQFDVVADALMGH